LLIQASSRDMSGHLSASRGDAAGLFGVHPTRLEKDVCGFTREAGNAVPGTGFAGVRG